MKTFKIICIGNQKFSDLADLEQKYQKKLQHFINLELINLKEIKISDENIIRKKEAEQFQKSIGSGDYVIALDEKGKKMTSFAFARFLEEKLFSFPGSLVFLIGGFAGFDARLNESIHAKLSFSDFTFPHDICRVLLLEQLFRAYTIIKGITYHR
jgi:23S rRNA (pseudouridine1915-N3)-methyltransferase